jgi:hypothetical protein
MISVPGNRLLLVRRSLYGVCTGNRLFVSLKKSSAVSLDYLHARWSPIVVAGSLAVKVVADVGLDYVGGVLIRSPGRPVIPPLVKTFCTDGRRLAPGYGVCTGNRLFVSLKKSSAVSLDYLHARWSPIVVAGSLAVKVSSVRGCGLCGDCSHPIARPAGYHNIITRGRKCYRKLGRNLAIFSVLKINV